MQSRPMDPEAVADDAIDSLERFRDVVEQLGPDEWSLPTGCPGWDVHDVVAHVVGFEAMLDGEPVPDVAFDRSLPANDVARLNQAWVESLRSSSPQEMVDSMRSLVVRRSAQLRSLSSEAFAEETWSPVGTVPYARFLQVRTFDVWFHEQDVREAVGRPGGWVGGAAARAATELLGAIGYVVSKRGGAPDGSSVRFALAPATADDEPATIDVLVDGRARVVGALDGEPTATIATDVATFFRLAGGRVEPSSALGDGRVAVVGDVALGTGVVEHLGYVI